MDNVQKTNVSKFTKPSFKKNTQKVSTLSAYDSMVILRRDLYYKDIVNNHKEDIQEKTEFAIKEILYCFERNWISKREVFEKLEQLRSGYSCTDLPIKFAVRALRAK